MPRTYLKGLDEGRTNGGCLWTGVGCRRVGKRGAKGTTGRVDVPKIPQTNIISYNLFIILFPIEYDGTQN